MSSPKSVPVAQSLAWAKLDVVVAALLLATIEIQLWTAGAPRIAAIAGGVVFTVPVAVRRRWPLEGALAILVVLLGKTIVSRNAGPLHQTDGVLPALLLVFYGLGAFAPPRRSRWVLGLAVVVSSLNTLATRGRGIAEVPFSVMIVTVLPYGLGTLIRRRAVAIHSGRERAEQLEAETELVALTAANQERARIARELHDVVTHSVSVMVIQAGGARMVMATAPDRAEASLLSVERAGREALVEIRGLLGGTGNGREAGLTPQPGLRDIDDVLARAREAGVTTEVEVAGEPRVIPPALDLCAFRVVQEAITNTIKHAAPAHAEVRLTWLADRLEIRVVDDGRRPKQVAPTSVGHGIIGMRERVALYGGTIRVGARQLGGYSVDVCLPLRSAAGQ